MIDKRYIRYYISGYLNFYFCERNFSYDPSQESFVQFRLRSTLRYLGLNDTKKDFSWLAPALSLAEALIATLLVFVRFFGVMPRTAFTKKQHYDGRLFLASLGFATFRLKGLLENIKPREVTTIRIPFIKNDYSENEVDILSVITTGDVCESLVASWKTIWLQYRKYRRRDSLFRSFSSFEYYLTCCFVRKTESKNHYIFYNTYDRWAFLMCNTSEAIFIQHGKLMDTLRFIKVGTPHTAYYLSKRQGRILEKVLFNSVPKTVGYRQPITFTSNELLQHNGKKNVLLVCWNRNIEKEWEICRLLSEDFNLYIKPHPGDKDNPEYPCMAERHHCIIIPKTGYPHVDVVVSYDSTLADEYEDVDVKVVRYDLLSDLKEIISMI